MKKFMVILICALIVASSATAVSAAILSPGLDVIAGQNSMTVSALSGEDVLFTAEQFCDAIGSDELSKIKITQVPDEADGVLCFGDVAVTEGQIIGADLIKKLRFEPCAKTDSASFGFCVDDSYSMICNLMFSDKLNEAPKVYDPADIYTFTDTSVSGEMRATDSEGDRLYYEVVDYPENGSLTFDSTTGDFTYTAGSRICNDTFTYRVRDSMGEYSDIVSCSVIVRENDSETVLSDMEKSESLAAATVMTDLGYMSCSEKDGKLCFSPDSHVSRLDFLVLCMNVFGASRIPAVEKTGFADDNKIPDKYKGYVYSAAKLGIINDAENSKSCFDPDSAVTKAEASVILNNIIGYKAKTPANLDNVPDWASEAVSAMYELGIYSLENGRAECNAAVTKDSAAQMLYNVLCLVGE